MISSDSFFSRDAPTTLRRGGLFAVMVLAGTLAVAARGLLISQSIDPTSANLANLGHFSGDQQTADHLTAEIDEAVGKGHWIFYMIHGIGTRSDYGIDRFNSERGNWIDAEEHRKLVEYLSANRSSIWTAPAVEVATYVKNTSHP